MFRIAEYTVGKLNEKPDTANMQRTSPAADLFDILSYYATIWCFVVLCVWSEHEALRLLGVPETPRLSLAGVSAIALFIFAADCFKKDQRVKRFVEQVRYVVILAAAALFGAYLYAQHKDNSYESALREGAFLASSKIESCQASAAQYANTP